MGCEFVGVLVGGFHHALGALQLFLIWWWWWQVRLRGSSSSVFVLLGCIDVYPSMCIFSLIHWSFGGLHSLVGFALAGFMESYPCHDKCPEKTVTGGGNRSRSPSVGVHITAHAQLDSYVRHVVVSHPLADFIIQMSLFDILLIIAPSDLLILQSTVVPLKIWD